MQTKKKKESKALTVLIDQALFKAIKVEAAKLEVSIREIVENSLRVYIKDVQSGRK